MKSVAEMVPLTPVMLITMSSAATKPAVENSSGETTATSPDTESAVEVGDPAESHSNTMAGSAE